MSSKGSSTAAALAAGPPHQRGRSAERKSASQLRARTGCQEAPSGNNDGKEIPSSRSTSNEGISCFPPPSSRPNPSHRNFRRCRPMLAPSLLGTQWVCSRETKPNEPPSVSSFLIPRAQDRSTTRRRPHPSPSSLLSPSGAKSKSPSSRLIFGLTSRRPPCWPPSFPIPLFRSASSIPHLRLCRTLVLPAVGFIRPPPAIIQGPFLALVLTCRSARAARTAPPTPDQTRHLRTHTTHPQLDTPKRSVLLSTSVSPGRSVQKDKKGPSDAHPPPPPPALASDHILLDLDPRQGVTIHLLISSFFLPLLHSYPLPPFQT